MESVAASYGLALFELGKEENKLSAYKKDLDFIQSALDSGALKFFNQAMVSQEDRIAVIEKCFKESIDGNVLNFLKLLIVKGRMNHLFEIMKEFSICYNEEMNIREGICYSVSVLDEKTLKDIEQAISKKEGHQIVLSQKIDESLIGGIRVVVEDKVYDASIKNRIALMQSELMKGSR